jgi:hypothetical protein
MAHDKSECKAACPCKATSNDDAVRRIQLMFDGKASNRTVRNFLEIYGWALVKR